MKYLLHSFKEGETNKTTALDTKEADAIATAQKLADTNRNLDVSLVTNDRDANDRGRTVLHVKAQTFTTTVFKKGGERAGRFHFDTREADARSHAQGWVNSDPDIHTATVTNDKNEIIAEFPPKSDATVTNDKTKK